MKFKLQMTAGVGLGQRARRFGWDWSNTAKCQVSLRVISKVAARECIYDKYAEYNLSVFCIFQTDLHIF